MMDRDLDFINDKLLNKKKSPKCCCEPLTFGWLGWTFIPIIIISSKLLVIDLISLRWNRITLDELRWMAEFFVEFLCVLRANRANLLLLSPSRLLLFSLTAKVGRLLWFTKAVFTTHFLMIISGTEYRRLPRKICCRLHDANLSLSIRRRRRCERTRWWAVAAASESGDVSVEMSSLDSDDPRLRERMNFLIIFQIPMIRQKKISSAQ